MHRTFAFALVLAAPLVVAACHHGPTECTDPNTPGCLVASDKERIESPKVSSADLDAAVAGNTAFAIDLYQRLRTQPGNLFYSPFSISEALAMTWAGARNETEKQMAKALHLTLGQSKQHAAFDALDLALASRGQSSEGQDGHPFALDVANALWGQIGYPFESGFLDTTAQYYGAGMHVVDFAKSPDGSAKIINDWVAERTEDKIQNLIAPGTLDSSTRLVLTNAIYFNARWAAPFDASATKLAGFTRPDGSKVQAQTMSGSMDGGYGKGDGYESAWLDYDGNELSMYFIMPTAGTLDDFEAKLTPERLASIMNDTMGSTLTITMPRFELESSFGLAEQLEGLGMGDAFTSAADFSGMSSTKELFISNVHHKAYINVDESGTEAAAATDVDMEAGSAPMEPAEIHLDHAFLFLIRDNATKTVLFLGRVTDPS